MELDAVAALFPDLDRSELTSWVEQRWVQPEPAMEGAILVFHEIDIARVHLIYDLRRDLETPVETMPMILALLDQVYELRSTLKSILAALRDQPADVQAAILQALRPEDRQKLDGA